MRAGSQTGRALGLIRSLAVYHVVPLRQRRLRRLYATFAGPGDLAFDLGAHVGRSTWHTRSSHSSTDPDPAASSPNVPD